MKKYYCLRCLREHAWNERQCPVCGQEHGKEKNKPGELECGIILHGRYLVGIPQSLNKQYIEYPCLDLLEEKKVFVQEYFPRNAARRKENQVQWKNGEAQGETLCAAFLQENPGLDQFQENGTVYTVREAPIQSENIVSEKGAGAVKIRVAAGIGAAVVVLFLSWCGIWHFQGNQAMKAENYVGAVSAFRKDLLFSRSSLQQAMENAGEQAFADGRFADAAAWFLQMGESGQARYSDSLYEQAKELIEAKEFASALEILELISGEKRAAEQIGVAQLGIAQEQYQRGETKEAIQTAQSIQDTTYADVTGFLNTVYMDTAFQCMDAGNLSGAISAFRKCSGVAEAQVNLSILEQIEQKNFAAAARDAVAAVDGKTTSISRQKWQKFFDSVMGKQPSSNNTDSKLSYAAAKHIIGDPVDFENETVAGQYEQMFACGEMINTTYFDLDTDIPLTSMEELYAQCGNAASGKVLVVIRTRNFPDRTTNQLISQAAMEMLPAQLYPASLAEVEYIAVVDYDYSRVGSYTKGTIATRESGKVEVIQVPGEKRVSLSSSRWGDNAPSSFVYWGTPPEWKSGGSPNMGKDLYNAILKLI